MTALRKTWQTVRLSLVREPAPEPYRDVLRMGSDAARMVRAFIAGDPRESFVAVYLDNRHKVLAIHRVSIGTADASMVHPREVFGPALTMGAVALVVAHNHPSGDPMPSTEDRLVTERLRQAGDLLGVQLLDHVVIGSDRFYSFSEESSRPYEA
jgi:DNA repair protein RadC